MLSSRFSRFLQVHLRCQCQPRLFASSLASSSSSEVSGHETELPINQFGVPLIPDKLKSRIFPQPKQSSAVTDEALIKEAQCDLTKFGLTERSAETRLPDVTPYLPHITDTNISHHLWKVAGDQASTCTYYVTHYNYMMFMLLKSNAFSRFARTRTSCWSCCPRPPRHGPRPGPCSPAGPATVPTPAR